MSNRRWRQSRLHGACGTILGGRTHTDVRVATALVREARELLASKVAAPRLLQRLLRGGPAREELGAAICPWALMR